MPRATSTWTPAGACSATQCGPAPLYDRYAAGGAAALAHGLRGKASNHRRDSRHRAQALALYRKNYCGFGPTLAAEQMLEREKIRVDHETLRRWLSAEGLWKGSRQRQKHRSRRPRRSCRGELVQLDGSPHAWLEGRGPRMSLIEFVDDATSLAYGRFYPEETTEAVMDCFARYIRQRGVPRALYVDKDSIYVVNIIGSVGQSCRTRSTICASCAEVIPASRATEW